ncbi:ABC transporter permease [Aquimarina addita]|uniref:ABC transporter permease n=1 Tax=Aquimarina addita TaxID=870485 RepID=A0ABP6UR13_9FLAO
MFKNYIKIAWRNLKKQPFFTFLNIVGLAFGIAGCLLISLYLYDELHFDTMFKDADRIHRVHVDIKFGGEENKLAVVTAPMASTLQQDFAQVEMATRFRTWGSILLRETNTEVNVKELHSTYADSTFFDMFGIELLVGDVKNALKDPNSLVLTKTAVEKHFKINEALGKTLVLNNKDVYTITGVINDLPENSFLRNHTTFMSMASLPNSKEINWVSNNFATFIKLKPATNIEDFNTSLASVVNNYVIPAIQVYFPGITKDDFHASENYMKFSTMSLKDIHLHSNRVAEISPNGTIQNIYILSFIALFLIVLASVNFMNLSTAQSLKRSKEVGIRKTLGSDKLSIIKQFLTESGVISFISLILALIIVLVGLPFFNELTDKNMSFPYSNPLFWITLIIFTLILALFSGSYPAFFMSNFSLVKTLKGENKNNKGGLGVRNLLVVFQFSISILLIISTLVVFQQLKFIQNKDLGFMKDQVLIVDDVYTIGNKRQAFKEQIQQLSVVNNATLSSYFPTPSNRSDNTFNKDRTTDQENAVSMQNWRVDHDYISTIGLEIIAGRNFDKQFKTDSTSTIINESALAILGMPAHEILGTKLSRIGANHQREYLTVIGVVKNFHFESLREDIGALSLVLGNQSNALAIKLDTTDYISSVTKIKSIWDKIAPGQPFNYYFMDASFNESYKAEQQLGSVFMIFTSISILIACLGLFGLAAFNAEKRTKEIGVRKVLGASIRQISYKLSIDFLKLVGIAIVIAVPLGWYVMNRWLEDFSYRIEISWTVLAFASFLAIIISIVTVSYQSIKAAVVNPIKSLRTE